MYANNLGPIENFSSDIFPKDEVHKIAILDLRMLNLDRNLCNMLVCSDNENGKETFKIIPIDHGLSIPDTLAVNSYELAWLSFKQAEQCFSERSLEFIENLNIRADIAMLEKHLPFRPECLRNMRISSTLLKFGALGGLTLAQIGQILCRPDDDDSIPSQLENLVKRANNITQK